MDFYIDSRFDRNRLHITFENIKVTGYFSVKNCGKEIAFDCSNLRYYKYNDETSVYFDLNVGIEHAKYYCDSYINRHLDKLLYWILKFHNRIEASPSSEKKWLQPDFAFRRGVIEVILKTPFNINHEWILCAAKYKGTIYLSIFLTEEQDYDRKLHCESPSTCWGHKFEQYIVTDTVDGLPNITEPVDQNAQFCCVLQSDLGKHSLLYCAEVDGVCADKALSDPLPLDDLKFIELKTHRTIDNPMHRKKFAKYTSLTMWSQTVAVGITNVLCGFKDTEGIVREIANFNITDLINMSKFYWQPSVSLNFFNDFLDHISNTVVNDCDTTVYQFHRIPYKRIIEMTELSSSSGYLFIPEWYKI